MLNHTSKPHSKSQMPEITFKEWAGVGRSGRVHGVLVGKGAILQIVFQLVVLMASRGAGSLALLLWHI
jgi:hypothetical protein